MPAAAQRHDALHKANHVRLARARLHHHIATSSHHQAPLILAGLLITPPAELRTAQIGDVLCWLPRYGTTRVRKLLARHNVNWLAHIDDQLGNRTVAVLTDRQRRLLAHALSEEQSDDRHTALAAA